MKTLKARNAGFLACAFGLVGFLGAAPHASAQYRSRRDVLSSTSYDRMRRWARELDRLSDQANRQAQAEQGGYRGFRRDTKFLRSIDHFARRADQFDAKMNSYRTRPWNIGEEIEHLLRDAREVQTRISRARYANWQTRRDWDRVVYLLNQMSTEYRADIGNGPYGNYPTSRYPDRRYPDDRYPGDPSDYSDSTDLRQLARELDERAARASQLADRYGNRYGYSTDVRRFSDEARDFRNAVDSRHFSRSELRSRVNRLLEEAQDAHNELLRTRVSSDLAVEWDGIVQVLNRMRDLAV
jgi:hypothetical protein